VQKISSDAAGISKLDLKRQNRMHVLRYLRNMGPTCRVDIADGIGITKAAVTIIINEMIAEGILQERGEQPPDADGKVARGRKKILVDICDTCKLVLGLLIDGEQFTLGLCTLKGRTVEKQTCPLPAQPGVVPMLRAIREMYDSILYKNGLKPEMMAGMGICISSEHYDSAGVSMDERGRLDYTAFEQGLRVFCNLPVAFGTVAEGAAVAEIEFHPENERPPVNAVIQRTDRDLDCAVVIGRELYRGSTARPGIARMPVLPWVQGDPAAKLYYPEMFRLVYAGLERADGRDFREEMRRKGIRDPMKFFCRAAFRTGSPYYAGLMQELEDTYYWLFSSMYHAYAPDCLILIGEGGAERAVENALRRINRPGLGVDLGLCRRSILREYDLFKGAAALAVREFFIDRGGL